MILLELVAAVSIGLVLVFALIQWGTAQRRELLYFYLTLEKPVSEYFREARESRAQHSRLAAAALVLLARETLVLAGLLDGSDTSFTDTAGGAGLWLQSVGLALLSYALLFPSHGTRPLLVVFAAVSTVVCTAGAAASFAHAWSPSVEAALWRGTQGALALAAIVVTRSLPASARPLRARAYLLWLVGPVSAVLWAHQAAMGLFFCVLTVRVFVNLLDRYDELELGHHRRQRQYEVIVGFLERIGAAYSAALDLQAVLRIVVEAGVETTGASAGAIYLLDSKTQELQVRAVQGPFPPLYLNVPIGDLRRRSEELVEAAMGQRFRLGQGIIGQAAQRGEAIRVPDAREAGILTGSVGDP
ncbi:MAG: GAF domain-containing protein, partial [Armatimonadota bacterium]|nr:GAF domain-containing protein [Armatimonadota bacterium]